VPSFVCRALANMPIEIYGDGSQVSDMVYAADVAKALVISLEKATEGVVFSEVVEVGPDDHITIRKFAEMVIDACASESEIINLPMRPGEIPGATVSADCATLRHVNMRVDDLVPLDQGLALTVDYYRNLVLDSCQTC